MAPVPTAPLSTSASSSTKAPLSTFVLQPQQPLRVYHVYVLADSRRPNAYFFVGKTSNLAVIRHTVRVGRRAWSVSRAVMDYIDQLKADGGETVMTVVGSYTDSQDALKARDDLRWQLVAAGHALVNQRS